MPGAQAEALEARADLAAASGEAVGRAVDLAHSALTLRADHGLRAAVVRNLEALARHGVAVKATGDDARILAASETARESMGIPRTPDQQARFERTADGSFAALSAPTPSTRRGKRAPA